MSSSIHLLTPRINEVRVKSWEAMEREFGVDSDGAILGSDGAFFTHGMRHLCGRQARIAKSDSRYVRLEGLEEWPLSLWMLEIVSFVPSEAWVCPSCGHKQNGNLEWCGKNLKCQGCGTVSYYKEWTREAVNAG